MSFQHSDKEIEAMMALSKAMSVFVEEDRETVGRILVWFNGRYGFLKPHHAPLAERNPVGFVSGADGNSNTKPSFETPADLFDAASPDLEYEKAIVVGYWFQVCEGQPDFNAQDVNSTLTNLGHKLKNITDSFSTAMERKPALVIQTQKTGTSKQARKLYKLTTAGIRLVENRLKLGGRTLDAGKEE